MFALLIGAVLISSFGMIMTRTVMFHGMFVADGLGTFLKLIGFVTMAHRGSTIPRSTSISAP